jgi:hypothetical protein
MRADGSPFPGSTPMHPKMETWCARATFAGASPNRPRARCKAGSHCPVARSIAGGGNPGLCRPERSRRSSIDSSKGRSGVPAEQTYLIAIIDDAMRRGSCRRQPEQTYRRQNAGQRDQRPLQNQHVIADRCPQFRERQDRLDRRVPAGQTLLDAPNDLRALNREQLLTACAPTRAPSTPIAVARRAPRRAEA